jgi:hypothetical protein
MKTTDTSIESSCKMEGCAQVDRIRSRPARSHIGLMTPNTTFAEDDNSGESPTLFDGTSATPLHRSGTAGILSEDIANVVKNRDAVKKNGCNRATRKWQHRFRPALCLYVRKSIRDRAESLRMQPLFPKRCVFFTSNAQQIGTST